jgi:hypothetical protein
MNWLVFSERSKFQEESAFKATFVALNTLQPDTEKISLVHMDQTLPEVRIHLNKRALILRTPICLFPANHQTPDSSVTVVSLCQ